MSVCTRASLDLRVPMWIVEAEAVVLGGVVVASLAAVVGIDWTSAKAIMSSKSTVRPCAMVIILTEAYWMR